MDEETNDLIVPLEEKEVIQDRATSQWFGNSDWFDGLEDGAEVDQSNINQILKDKKKEKKPKKESAGPKSEEMGDEDQMEVEEPQVRKAEDMPIISLRDRQTGFGFSHLFPRKVSANTQLAGYIGMLES